MCFVELQPGHADVRDPLLRIFPQANHPNIAAIYGLEDADGETALVLELVKGPTLADRIAQGPIRSNIKVTPDGTIKVLDFGLAKITEPIEGAAADEAGPLSHSPTLTVGATRVGIVLGTAAYMSPEQAKGKPVDRRADIWAFGCVLYEMLPGRRAFEGDEISDSARAFWLHAESARRVPDRRRKLREGS